MHLDESHENMKSEDHEICMKWTKENSAQNRPKVALFVNNEASIKRTKTHEFRVEMTVQH